MTWDEWERIKAEVAARGDGAGRMELNGTGGAAASADLKTSAQGKRAAVKALEGVLLPGVDRAGGHADPQTDAAEAAFTGWATGSGLKDAHDAWASQVKGLKARLERDRSALSRTKREFQQIDLDVRSTLARIDPPEREPRRNV
ncbi:hypothetical protein HHL19_09315 [Streptomyces sp. R302]|uniref:hypothetical protein n=1 Tax=unclassified Streptomyces TaxID=2593676 RepID=UPI00145E7A2C|nr:MULTISPECIES: hypothetical protein [unclassified Streptomyces]NML53028.1 hypothetical protein [Streptomyces sp. R301]NML78863.1 hypothetical protein [Streptomyces sp. R302]